MFVRLSEILSDTFFLPSDFPIPEVLDITLSYRKELPDLPLSRIVTAYRYEAPFPSMLKDFKYSGDRSGARFFYEGIDRLADHCRTVVPKGSFVTFPPAPFFRSAFRGYDHTRVLAERFSRKADLELLPVFSVRPFRDRQAGKSIKERTSNVSGKFIVDSRFERAIRGRNAVFFDDVVTTAATATECCASLRNAGTECVFGYFLSGSTV